MNLIATGSRWIIASLPMMFFLGACGMSVDIFAELERRCHEEARLIVHDPDLWKEYLEEAEESYSSRAERYPETGRLVAEYAPSFQKKYGPDLNDRPQTVDGEVVRQDVYIMMDDEMVAQFINFYARRDFGGSSVRACLASFPELYDLARTGGEQ